MGHMGGNRRKIVKQYFFETIYKAELPLFLCFCYIRAWCHLLSKFNRRENHLINDM